MRSYFRLRRKVSLLRQPKIDLYHHAMGGANRAAKKIYLGLFDFLG
jgi:hypothetical protein